MQKKQGEITSLVFLENAVVTVRQNHFTFSCGMQLNPSACGVFPCTMGEKGRLLFIPPKMATTVHSHVVNLQVRGGK